MKSIKDNYITIQGWMVEKLKLHSNNLLVYALIYGFSQNEENEFTGSLKYISSWLNCSNNTVIKALRYLVDKNLIIKSTKLVNNVQYNGYKVNLGSAETAQGVVQKLHRGSAETAHNNTIYNTIYNYIYIENENIKEKEQLIKAFEMWLNYKKEKKQTYKSETSIKIALKKLIKLSNEDGNKAIEIVEQSIANNYSGLFELKDKYVNQRNYKRTNGIEVKTDADYTKDWID